MTTGKRKIQTITAADMRNINRAAILEMVRSAGPISRTQIAEDLNVSLPTVMRIIDELIADDLVIEDNRKEWSGGRKRKRLIFNGKNHLVVGIDLGGTKIYGAVANLDGEILHEIHMEHGQSQAEGSFAVLCDALDTLLSYANQVQLPVKGIGIGVPGVVVPESGMVNFAPALEWNDFPLGERLHEKYSYPIFIENDVNLAALGELWFGTEDQVNNLVLLAVGTGIGAGIVVNGSVYGGSHHMAGEVGYFLPDRSYLGQQFPEFGALELLASGTGIADHAQKVLAGILPREELEQISAADVFDAARRQEPWAVTILEDTIDYLALLIGSMSLFFDPDCILLGGGVARSSDLLIEPIRERLAHTLLAVPTIKASTLGYRAAILGSVVQLMRITSHYYHLEKYI